ncbi:MAG: DDE-type integrase/transposase/recombinase [Acutalibacteraceae bacterium]
MHSLSSSLQKLLSDITEIQCCDGKLYVSAVLDCYNGEILSVAMDSNMKKELCIRTVTELELQYGKKIRGAIFHSDRGSQSPAKHSEPHSERQGLFKVSAVQVIALITQEWKVFL